MVYVQSTNDILIEDDKIVWIYCNVNTKVHSEQLNNNEYAVQNNRSLDDGLFIYFRGCHLPALPRKFLQKFVNVKDIYLSFRGVRTINGDDFRRNVYLKRLIASYNKFTELPPFLFTNTPEITEVDFSHNRIIKIDPNAFTDGVECLEKINLESNRIKKLDGRLFGNAASLEYLNLKFNRMEYFGFRFVRFDGVRHLDSYTNFTSNCMILSYKREKFILIDIVQMALKPETPHRLDIIELNCDSDDRIFYEKLLDFLYIDGIRLALLF